MPAPISTEGLRAGPSGSAGLTSPPGRGHPTCRARAQIRGHGMGAARITIRTRHRARVCGETVVLRRAMDNRLPVLILERD